jgi:hypothetical protein
MGIFDSFKDIRKSANMVRAERQAEQKQEGLEPLMLILIEEVRQLRRELAAYQDDQRSQRR